MSTFPLGTLARKPVTGSSYVYVWTAVKLPRLRSAR